MCKKWTYTKELDSATTILLNAYLDTMHSKVITVIFTYENKLYYHDCTNSELSELSRVTGKALATQKASKARVKKYLTNSTAFADISELSELSEDFPRLNNGWLSEFLYRIKINNETVKDIKKANNSKGYDLASDTKDGKQIKNIDKGATFTQFEYLLTACKRANYKELAKVEEAISTLQKIYKED